jgi:Sec-independent protein secretion pathway component TatC
MSRPLLASLVAGVSIGALAWIDPLFVPLVLAGPIVSGVVAAARSVPFRLLGAAWAAAGVVMLVSDWIVNDEDQVFHAVLTVVMVALAGIGWGTARVVQRRRVTAEA